MSRNVQFRCAGFVLVVAPIFLGSCSATRPSLIEKAADDVGQGSLSIQGQMVELPNVIAFEEIMNHDFGGQHAEAVISVVCSEMPIKKKWLLSHFEDCTVLDPSDFGSWIKLRYGQDGELIDCHYRIENQEISGSGSLLLPESTPQLTTQRMSDATRVSGKVQIPRFDQSFQASCSASFSTQLLMGQKVAREKAKLAARPVVKQGTVDGELAIDGKIYKLTHVVAYETTSPAATVEVRSNVDRKNSTKICVLLSCENVPVDDLIASLQNDGSDNRMRLYGPFVRFYFERTGQPYSCHIQEKRHSSFAGNAPLLGEIRTSDGRVSGSCSKSEGFPGNHNKFAFHASFDAELVFQFPESQ